MRIYARLRVSTQAGGHAAGWLAGVQGKSKCQPLLRALGMQPVPRHPSPAPPACPAIRRRESAAAGSAADRRAGSRCGGPAPAGRQMLLAAAAQRGQAPPPAKPPRRCGWGRPRQVGQARRAASGAAGSCGPARGEGVCQSESAGQQE
jgi:hypothetical protein